GAGQAVIDAATSGGAARQRQAYRHRPAGNRRKRNRHGQRGDGFGAAGSGRAESNRRGRVVVSDDGGDLLSARFGAVGDVGNIYNDRFVIFVQGVLHRRECDRAVGAARGDDNRSAGVGVITAQSGRAGEG